MRFALLLCFVLSSSACNIGPLGEAKEEKKEEGNGSETKTGTLAVGEQAEAQAIAAATALQQIAEGFVPSSMKVGQVAAETAQLLDGPPKFCQDNPGNQMCSDCGPSGSLSGSQTCQAFFGPGGEGYTSGENFGGNEQAQSGGEEGQGNDQGPCFRDANTNGKRDVGEESVGFLECQPILTRLFLNVAADSMKQLAEVLKDSAEKIKDLESDAGKVELPSDERFSAIQYKVEGETKMEFVFLSKEGTAVLRVKLDDKVYTLDDLTLGASDIVEDQRFFKHVLVNFSDEKKWDTRVELKAVKCNPEDPQAPQNMVITMNRSDTLWEGKSNLWMPRWPQGGCEDPITETSGISIDTDITGEKAFTTGGTYIVPLTVASLDFESIKQYALTKICENFPAAEYPSLCHGDGVVLDNQKLPSSHVFCSKADLSYSYGGPCTGSEFPNVAAGTFGAHPWVSPKELSELVVEIK